MLDQRKLHIVHVLTSLKSGGAQEVLRTLCAFTSHRAEHTVFYMTGSNAYCSGDDSLATARSLNVTGFLSLIGAVRYLSRFLKETPGPVCIQGWLYQGNLLALLVKLISPRVSVMLGIHNGSDRREFTSLSGFLASRMCSLLSGMAKLTVFVSQKSLVSHVPYKNSVVIPNPVRSLIRVGDDIQPILMPMASEVVLAYIARFDPVKNIEFMLNILQDLRSRHFRIRLLMVGDGMTESNKVLVKMIHAKKLEGVVELLGVVSDIASVYKGADYTLLTSKCESFSNVLLESIACGTPFISSDVGIASDLVSSESLVIQGYDVSIWREKLEQILRIKKSWSISQSVSRHYERVAEIYAPERIAQLYVDRWERAMGR